MEEENQFYSIPIYLFDAIIKLAPIKIAALVCCAEIIYGIGAERVFIDQVVMQVGIKKREAEKILNLLVEIGVMSKENDFYSFINMKQLGRISQEWERDKVTGITFTPYYKTEIITITEEEKGILIILSEIKGFPTGYKEDVITIKLLRNLEEEFLIVDARELVKNWVVYKQDQPFQKRSSPRAQLRNQFKMASHRGMFLKSPGLKGEGRKYGEKVSRYKG